MFRVAIFCFNFVFLTKIDICLTSEMLDYLGNPAAQRLAEAIVSQIGDRPTAMIMDNRNLASLKKYWDTLKLTHKMGTTFYIYDNYLETHPKEKVRPNPSQIAYRYISYEWAFVCFLDEAHTKESLEAYLKQMLYIGNGRSDVFIFLGVKRVLEPILRSKRIQKFRNIIGFFLDDLTPSVSYRETCRNPGNFPLSETDDLFRPKWIRAKANCLPGQNFKISPTDFPPFMYYIRPEDSESGKLEIHGTNVRILTTGAKRYNYSLTILNEKDPFQWGLMGELKEDGAWDGVFGDLVYGRVHIASVSNPTAERNGLGDFIGPFGKSNLVFMSAEPLTYASAGEYWIFNPFTYHIWLLILAGFFFVWMINSIALKIRSYRRQDRYYAESYKKAFTMVMAFTFEQEIGKPKGFPLRFMMMSWVSFMVIVATAYKYNLAAFILAPSPAYVPRTFQELYYLPNYKIIFDLGGISGWYDFNKINDTKIKSLRSRTTSTQDTSRCTYEAFMEIETVCAGWDFSLTFAAAKNLSISMSPKQALYKSEPLFETWFVFATENNSVFTNEFQQLGQTLYESGFLKYWEDNFTIRERYRGRRWLGDRKHTKLYKMLTEFQLKNTKGRFETMKVKNVEFIFIIFLTGIGISIGAFLAEFLRSNGFLQRFVRKRGVRIRKISKTVMRKISNSKTAAGGDGSSNVITVTFMA